MKLLCIYIAAFFILSLPVRLCGMDSFYMAYASNALSRAYRQQDFEKEEADRYQGATEKDIDVLCEDASGAIPLCSIAEVKNVEVYRHMIHEGTMCGLLQGDCSKESIQEALGKYRLCLLCIWRYAQLSLDLVCKIILLVPKMRRYVGYVICKKIQAKEEPSSRERAILKNVLDALKRAIELASQKGHYFEEDDYTLQDIRDCAEDYALREAFYTFNAQIASLLQPYYDFLGQEGIAVTRTSLTKRDAYFLGGYATSYE